ncbi:MAG: DNA polymerase, partial [Candidatus Dormibacteria bacterium]
FGDYCRQDVISEREIMRRLSILKVFPLPERERRIWLLDQKINDAGIPTDREFVQKSLTIAERAKAEALEQQKKATGLDNPNSNSQMLAWVRERGFPGNSLRKEPVKIAIEDTTNELTQEARDALIARKVSSSTSYKKLSAILRQLSSDDRLKNQFIFMGSARAGRWSGNAVQFQNLARPEPQFEDLDNLDKARNLILAEDYDGIVKNFGSPLLVVKSCIRSAFVAPKGKRLNVADFSAIETRVGAWLAGCESLMDVFRQGRDPYLAFAVKMYQISYEMLDNWYHSADKEKKILVKGYRQIAKPGVLGCVYRLGPGSWGKNKYGDPIKTGLWGYAENMGIKMTQEKAQEVVRVFRGSYPEIVQLWYSFENAVEKVLRGGKKAEAFVGPNDCVRFDKLNRKDQFPILRMHLPSGRCLHYVDARIEDTTMPWKRINAEGIEESVFKPTLVYSGVNQDTKQWESFVTSNGGKLCLSGDTRVVTDRGIM